MLTIEENAVVKLIGGPANGFLALIPWTPVPSTSTRASCGPNTDSPRNRAVSQPRNRESEPIQKQGGGARASGPLAGSAAGHLQRPAISSRTICRAFDGTGAGIGELRSRIEGDVQLGPGKRVRVASGKKKKGTPLRTCPRAFQACQCRLSLQSADDEAVRLTFAIERPRFCSLVYFLLDVVT